MGSMHTGLEEHPDGSSRLAAFYAERARGGVGLIITGGFAPNAAGRVFEEGAELVSEDQLDFHPPIMALPLKPYPPARPSTGLRQHTDR